MNKGNFVNRIGLARRRMWMARFVAVVAIGVAIVGWTRPVKTISPVRIINSNCMEYAETMCNNGKD